MPPFLSTEVSKAIVERNQPDTTDMFTASERLVAMEIVAPYRVGLFQYVGDTFSIDSTAFGLQLACQADFLFERFWRHRFATGAKGATVLPVKSLLGMPSVELSAFATPPRVADCMSVLGVEVDGGLTFETLLAMACARFIKESQATISTMRDSALGLVWQGATSQQG